MGAYATVIIIVRMFIILSDPKCDIGERSFNDEWCVMLRPLTPESHDNDYLSSDTWCKRQGYIGVFAPVDENLSKQLLAWMANIKPGG